jgi:antitoxin (DNA-binding transcriptional repressor) of toxin-antitoxin stability system
MRSHPTVSEVASNFSEYIDRVVHRGERFWLMRDLKPVAELRPVEAESPRLRDLPRLLASLPHLAPGDADAFETDLAGARRELDNLPVRDPWES